MRLAERLGSRRNAASVASAAPAVGAPDAVERLHALVLQRMDLTLVSQLPPAELRQQLARLYDQLLSIDGVGAGHEQRESVIQGALDELIGLGPLETLLSDPSVTDIVVNSASRIFIEREGRMTPAGVRFRDDRHLLNTIQRIVARVGRRLDESSAMVDARLPDGSRVNAVIPPLALDGPALSIRRFGRERVSPQDLVRSGALSQEMLDYLAGAVRAPATVLITGGTGAGKTTLLNALSSFIPGDQRIITIEDAAELRLGQPNVVRMEARPPNLEGKGEVTIRDLVRNALRMRPDRIVVGEVRGAEVLDMLQAMNTGHEGSLSTIHANGTGDAVNRLMTMLGMAGTAFSEDTMRALVARAIQVVVHVARLADGRRRVTGIAEVTEDAQGEIIVHDVFTFERPAAGESGQHRRVASSIVARLEQAPREGGQMPGAAQ